MKNIVTRTLMVLATLSTMAACTSAEEEESDFGESSNAISSDGRATITPTTIDHSTPGCSAKLVEPHIQGKTPAATAAMMGAMPAFDVCQYAAPTDKTRIESTYKVTANRDGIVSVLMKLSSGDIYGRTFAIETGRQLGLEDVLSREGKTKLSAACEAWLRDCGHLTPLQADMTCHAAMIGDVAFSVEKSGLRLSFYLPGHVSPALVAEGVLVPWADLSGGVQPVLESFVPGE